MWWRFLIFCVLVCIVLFVVLSCIHGRPIVHLLYHKCYKDDVNGQVVFEHVDSNFLRERLVGVDIVLENSTDLSSLVNKEEEFDEIMEVLREKLNVHDPRARSELYEDVFLEENVGTDSASDTAFSTESDVDDIEMTTRNNKLLTASVKRKIL